MDLHTSCGPLHRFFRREFCATRAHADDAKRYHGSVPGSGDHAPDLDVPVRAIPPNSSRTGPLSDHRPVRWPVPTIRSHEHQPSTDRDRRICNVHYLPTEIAESAQVPDACSQARSRQIREETRLASLSTAREPQLRRVQPRRHRHAEPATTHCSFCSPRRGLARSRPGGPRIARQHGSAVRPRLLRRAAMALHSGERPLRPFRLP